MGIGIEEGISLIEMDRTPWTETAASFADHNYEQAHDFVTTMAGRAGMTTRFTAVKSAGRIIGAAAVRSKNFPFLRGGVDYISSGPLVQPRDEDCVESYLDRLRMVLKALKREFVHDTGRFLLLRLPISHASAPPDEKFFSDLGFRATHRVRRYRTMLVNTGVNESAMQSGLAGKWRTDLRYSQKSDLQIEHGSDPAMQERFLKLFGEMQDAKNFDVLVDPRLFFSMSSRDMGLHILIATKDGQDAAGHVLSMLGGTAVYLFGATNEIGRSKKAGYLLNWQAMLTAKENDCSWYDLGGVDPDKNPGGYRFKNRMGGIELAASGPFEALPSGIVSRILDGALTLRDKLR